MSTVGAARLERLELENFRGFERLSLDFEDDFTVLVGANGAGKTTIVDALVLAIGPTWRGSGKANSSPATFPKPTNVRHGTTSARIRLTCGADGEHATLSSEYLHDARRFASADRRLSRPPRALVYRARRDVRDETSTAAEQSWAGSAMDRWDDASAAYKVFFLWFKDTEDLENEQIRHGEAVENIELAAVRRAITQLLPEFDDVRVRRRLEPFSQVPVLTLRKGDVELPFDAFSDGERTTVAMVGDIARRLALLGEREDPLQTPATVIIDEFEQHAHPGWQRQLVARFRRTFPNVQFIVTTHSPITVSEVEPRQLRVLEDFALVETEHGPGRDANAVLEDVFGVAPRNQEVQDALSELADVIEDASDEAEFDRADALLAKLDELVPGGADPEIVYYRNILARLREQ